MKAPTFNAEIFYKKEGWIFRTTYGEYVDLFGKGKTFDERRFYAEFRNPDAPCYCFSKKDAETIREF